MRNPGLSPDSSPGTVEEHAILRRDRQAHGIAFAKLGPIDGVDRLQAQPVGIDEISAGAAEIGDGLDPAGEAVGAAGAGLPGLPLDSLWPPR